MSIEQGLVFVIAVSAFFAPVWGALRSRPFRFAAAVVFPLLVAFALYWAPNLAEFHDAELQNWSGLFVGVWFVPAVVVSLALTFGIGLGIDSWRRKREISILRILR